MNRKKLVRRTIAAIAKRASIYVNPMDEIDSAAAQLRHLFRTQLVWAVRHHKIKLGEFNAT